jgi:DNA-binding MarR family transcriptional regulator
VGVEMNYVARKRFQISKYDPSTGRSGLTTDPSLLVLKATLLQNGSLDKISSAVVVEHIAARDKRSDFFESKLFSDPAWDLLLILYVTYLDQQRVSITDLTNLAEIPSTTALRWIARLCEQGLLTKTDDPTDNRRVYVALSFRGAVAMNGYFTSCGYAPSQLQ